MHTDRRTEYAHRTDRADDLAHFFHPDAPERERERRQMMARLDEWLADLRKEQSEEHA